MADYTFTTDPGKATHFIVSGIDQFGNPMAVTGLTLVGGDAQTVADAAGAGFTTTLAGATPVLLTAQAGGASATVEIDPTAAVLTRLVVAEG